MIMNGYNNATERRGNAATIGIRENEGGASGRDSTDHQYGRRIEADRSWTVYHVFTGVPACADAQVMTGLSRSDATNAMLFLNRCNIERLKKLIMLPLCALRTAETAACQS